MVLRTWVADLTGSSGPNERYRRGSVLLANLSAKSALRLSLVARLRRGGYEVRPNPDNMAPLLIPIGPKAAPEPSDKARLVSLDGVAHSKES